MNLGSVIKYKDRAGIITHVHKDKIEAYLGDETTNDSKNFIPEGAVKDVAHLVNQAVGRIYYYGGPSVGSDPEIFGFTEQGEVIPAWEWLPPKDEAREVLTPGDSRATTRSYWDGAQAEITTNRGHSCLAWLVDDIQHGLRQIHTMLKKHDKNAELKCEDVVKIPESYLIKASDHAVALGCAPSENAYGIEPIDIGHPRRHEYRYSGCHLHYRAPHSALKTHCQDWYPHGTIVMMDKILGVCLTALGRDLENPLRRKAYGRPGEFRMTDSNELGIEYRTPGAFVLSSPHMFNFAGDIGRVAYRFGLVYDGREFFLPDVKDLITNCDADAAYKVIVQNRSFFESIFTNAYGPNNQTMRILEKGLKAHNLVGTVERNWKLNEEWIHHNNQDTATWKRIAHEL